MTGQITMLLPDCVLPGCRRPVVAVGQPCGDCRNAFGAMLQPAGVALTAGEIYERDCGVGSAYERRGFA